MDMIVISFCYLFGWVVNIMKKEIFNEVEDWMKISSGDVNCFVLYLYINKVYKEFCVDFFFNYNLFFVNIDVRFLVRWNVLFMLLKWYKSKKMMCVNVVFIEFLRLKFVDWLYRFY